MSPSFSILLALLSLLIGCTQFHTGRSYLSEMEHDDSGFFNPSQDFRVVAGDSGRSWMTDEERRERTPASEDEVRDTLMGRSLKHELRSLEETQSEENLEFYNQHKQRFGTVSEKIYFLKLPHYERKEYLLNRGFIEETKAPAFSPSQRSLAVKKSDILFGMSKNDVVESWGKPLKVEVAGNPRNENERWLYRMNGAAKYIYFESGQVHGWE